VKGSSMYMEIWGPLRQTIRVSFHVGPSSRQLQMNSKGEF
jgi:hypothetical protein